MAPNWVVNHAYNTASYIQANDNPIEDGETVDSVADNRMPKYIWRFQEETMY